MFTVRINYNEIWKKKLTPTIKSPRHAGSFTGYLIFSLNSPQKQKLFPSFANKKVEATELEECSLDHTANGVVAEGFSQLNPLDDLW